MPYGYFEKLTNNVGRLESRKISLGEGKRTPREASFGASATSPNVGAHCACRQPVEVCLVGRDPS